MLSKENKQYKLWKKLINKKYRDLENKFLVYGPHLISIAKKYDLIMELVTSNENKDGILISKEMMKDLSQTETVFDQVAVCKMPVHKFESKLILALDDVQDPSNVGALIRSASAFGFRHMLISNKSADVYNEKTIRASQGAIFDISFERGILPELIDEYKKNGYHVMVADAHMSKDNEIKHDKKIIVLGNEGSGISQEVKQLADEMITIKTTNVESLNVSVAGSILMYLNGDTNEN